MRSVAHDLPPAVVAKCGWVNGLATIRQLGRAGVPVVALDSSRSALGFYSRYASPALCPDPLLDTEGFAQSLIALGDELGCPAPIFPANDAFLNEIARHADRFGERFLYPFPPWDIVGPIQTKRFQLERAADLGIPYPRTVDAPTGELGFPVLVKPSDPVGFQAEFRRHSFRCENMDELRVAFDRAVPYDPLIQEFIPGGDDELYTLGSYLAADGEALGLFSGRKLRQIPQGVGTCRVGEAVWVDEVVEQGLRYLRGLGFHGLSQIEFKRDPRDGSYKLMEINPRLWQWHGLAAACGVDFARIAYCDLLGDRPEPARMDSRPRRWAISLVAGARPIVPRIPYEDAIVARDDLRPAVVQLTRVIVPDRVRRLVRGARRRLRLSHWRAALPIGER